ncbi:MAG: SRPBCC family protein [Parachlamydiaceae bacterium]|nr:SRPBCC family protein [Parachlamydiaceae bacterium]
MYRIKYTQKIPLSLEESWEFFSTPANLKILTPKHLGFEIRNSEDMCKMYAGQVISYTIYPLYGIPVEWVSEITHVEENSYFIDQQRFGPYKYWHHEHRFQAIPNGVEIVDIVYYKMPLGILGKALHYLKVKRDVEEIFSYRGAVLEKLFGPYVPLT